jgi:hypothetical protein
VLANHPAYLGFLCFAFEYLEKMGVRPGGKGDFSHQFRNIESLWGLLNADADVSILNVTHYTAIRKRGDVSIRDVKKFGPLYARLNYGTLGHYSGPAISWGLLNPKGLSLSNTGRDLGIAWSHRKKIDFNFLIDDWVEGKKFGDIEKRGEASKVFRLDASPSKDECDIWKIVISQYCSKNGTSSPLWENPLSKEDIKRNSNAEEYPGYFPTIYKHYEKNYELLHRIELAEKFEQLVALIQFLFDWEYVKNLAEAKEVGLDGYASLKSKLQELIISRSIEYTSMPGFKEAGKVKGLFDNLAHQKTFSDLVRVLLDHHSSHQRSRGASPFIVDNEVIILGKVDKSVFLKLFEEVNKDSFNENLIFWHYRRDWHFHRARFWLDYVEKAVLNG